MPLFKCEELKTIYTQYRGEYEVTPKFEEQELKTKNKMLNKNVKVNKIYVGKTINENKTLFQNKHFIHLKGGWFV